MKFFEITDKALFIKKLIIVFVSVLGMGFFLSFLIMIGLGTDPCTYMNRSIAGYIGWTLGNWQLTLNLILLVIVIIFSRDQIGFGTIFNMVLIGYYADFFCWLWRKLIPEAVFSDMPARAILFALTLFGFIVSAACYMNSDMGVAPYDAVVVIISRHLPRIPFFFVRMTWDICAIIIGYLASREFPAPAIIIMAFALGPVITIVGRFMKRIVGGKNDH